MEWLEAVTSSVKEIGLGSTIVIVLLLLFVSIVILLTKKLIEFLSTIVEIRRKIVEQVSESRTELKLNRNELEDVTLELRGLRSDVRELFTILHNLLGPLMYETYAEIARRRSLPPGGHRHGDGDNSSAASK